jgi:RNA polymerase sigma factor (sigma-70 family)
LIKKASAIEEENRLLLHLWHQSQKGDSTAFCHLTEKLYRTLYTYALSFSTDGEFVKDTIQELLLKIWERKDRTEIQHVTIFFIRSLRNMILSEYRKKSVEYASIEADKLAPISDYRTIESDIEQMETFTEKKHKLQWAVNGLPKRQKEVVFLKFFEGMDNEQIAGVMQLNRQSVANLLGKAILTLRERIPSLYTMMILTTLLSGSVQ